MTSRGEAIDAVLRHHAKLGRLDYDTMVLEQPKPKPPPKEYTLQRRAKTAADSALPAATRFHPLPPASTRRVLPCSRRGGPVRTRFLVCVCACAAAVPQFRRACRCLR